MLPPSAVPLLHTARYHGGDDHIRAVATQTDRALYAVAESLSDWWAAHQMSEITERYDRHPSGTVIMILSGRSAQALGPWSHEHVYVVSVSGSGDDASPK